MFGQGVVAEVLPQLSGAAVVHVLHRLTCLLPDPDVGSETNAGLPIPRIPQPRSTRSVSLIVSWTLTAPVSVVKTPDSLPRALKAPS